MTRDLGLTLLTGFGHEDEFIDILLERYPARMGDAKEFARRRRILLLKTDREVGIDISLGGLPFEEFVVQRATPFEFEPGVRLRTCSAEDLIVLKLFASRPLDIRDAEGVALRHRNELDWRYMQEQLQPLAEAKEAPEIMDALGRLRTFR